MTAMAPNPMMCFRARMAMDYASAIANLSLGGMQKRL